MQLNQIALEQLFLDEQIHALYADKTSEKTCTNYWCKGTENYSNADCIKNNRIKSIQAIIQIYQNIE